MYLSMVVFEECLAEYHPRMIGHSDLVKIKFMGVQEAMEGQEYLPDHMLLEHVEYFVSHPVPAAWGCLCIGEPPEDLFKNNICLIFPENTDKTRLYHDIQKIFFLYNSWEMEIRKAMQRNATLEEMCNLCIPIFEKPIFIHDRNNELLAIVNEMAGQFSWQYDETFDKYYLPLEILNTFKSSDEYHKTLHTYGAHVFSANATGYRTLYVNLRIEWVYVGRVCLDEIGTPIRKRDYELLEFFADNIALAMQQGMLLVSDASNVLSILFKGMIDGKSYTKNQLANPFGYYNWHIDDTFQCITIFCQKSDNAIHTATNLTHRLANMFPNSCVFRNEYQIILVLNLTLENMATDRFFAYIGEFLRLGNLKAGVSMQGHDFMNFRYYYRQTQIAHEVGLSEDLQEPIYYFENYAFHYFFRQASQVLLPEMLCAPQLLKLIEYDKEHDTEFTYTLQRYLINERNIKITASELHIHRSTMNYRISRLKELLEIDLENSENRLYLLNSFYMLDFKELYQS